MPKKIVELEPRFCLNCSKQLSRLVPSQIKQGRGKYCSNRCANFGTHSHCWIDTLDVKTTGDKAYNTLHTWVRRNKQKPKQCEQCGQERYLQWANKDGKYRRNLNDYVALCVPCHVRYDVSHNSKIIRNQSGACSLRTTV